MEKFGELLEPLQVNRRGRLPLLYLAASQIRRLVLVMTVVYLQEYPVYSLFFVLVQTLVMITISGLVEPFKSKTSNLIDITNETFVVLNIYTLLCFTDFVSDKSVQNWVGYGQIIALCVSICIDLLVILM
jgi:hypothetical protein